MKTYFFHTLKLFLLLFAFQTAVYAQNSREFHVNANTGNDQNKGTKENPLKSLSEAAKRVNGLEGAGAVTVYISKGVYGMSETAKFNPEKWQFSKQAKYDLEG